MHVMLRFAPARAPGRRQPARPALVHKRPNKQADENRVERWREGRAVDDVEVADAFARHERVGLRKAVAVGEEHAEAALDDDKDAGGAVVAGAEEEAVRLERDGGRGLGHLARVVELQAGEELGGEQELRHVEAARTWGA